MPESLGLSLVKMGMTATLASEVAGGGAHEAVGAQSMPTEHRAHCHGSHITICDIWLRVR